MNTYNDIGPTKHLNIQCKHSRRDYNVGQYWCTANHDVLHCDEMCPFREEIIEESSLFTSSCPHNIYK